MTTPPYDPNSPMAGQQPGMAGGPQPGMMGGPQPGMMGGPQPGMMGGPQPGMMGGPQFGMPGVNPSLGAVVRRRGMWRVGIGAALFVLGLVISVATYAHAEQAGGTYIVAFGPLIAGVLLMVRGFATIYRSRRLG